MSSNEPTQSSESRRPRDSEESPRLDQSEAAARPGSNRGEMLEDALSRARDHAHASVAEALASILALLDAVSLAASGDLAKANGILAPATRALEELRNQLGGRGHESLPLIQSIAEALDTEIARWEERARHDPDARSVLRAFLGLRELLWEFGVRNGETPSSAAPARPSRSKKKPGAHRKNVQRVRVDG